jgi:hypothetical protein
MKIFLDEDIAFDVQSNWPNPQTKRDKGNIQNCENLKGEGSYLLL